VRSDRDTEARTLELRRLQERQVERDARPITAEDLSQVRRAQRDDTGGCCDLLSRRELLPVQKAWASS